jgi:hypothetical protein
MNRKNAIKVNARVIRLCKDCVHYSEQDDTCKVLSIINHKQQDVSSIKSLYCRTREDLCGMDARYYEPKQTMNEEYTKKKSYIRKTDDVQDIVVEHYSITYYIDGSSNICIDNDDADNYYDNLHQDFNDVY